MTPAHAAACEAAASLARAVELERRAAHRAPVLEDAARAIRAGLGRTPETAPEGAGGE